MSPTIRSIRVRLAAEQGFSLIELMVAMIVLILGIFATVASLDGARNLSDVAEHQAAAAHFAERDLEALLGRPYNELALNADPSSNAIWTSIGNANLPSSPNDERLVSNEVICTSLDASSPARPSDAKCPLVGTIVPVADWQDDKSNTRGKVYRYITWVNDASCDDSKCPGPRDYKRVTIAVTITTAAGETPTLTRQGPKKPTVVSAVKIDPLRRPAGVNQ